jgi:hypothetical protein
MPYISSRIREMSIARPERDGDISLGRKKTVKISLELLLATFSS